MPLMEVGGKSGGVVPAQNGGITANVDVNMGFDKIIPVKRLVIQPLIVMAKFA